MTIGEPGLAPRLGLRENWAQFTLLVVVNAFLGGMVEVERTAVPLIGARPHYGDVPARLLEVDARGAGARRRASEGRGGNPSSIRRVTS